MEIFAIYAQFHSLLENQDSVGCRQWMGCIAQWYESGFESMLFICLKHFVVVLNMVKMLSDKNGTGW